MRSRDRAFRRHFHAASSNTGMLDEGSAEFLEKYANAHSTKDKAQLREVWQMAGEDVSNAGLILKARRVAFKEHVTEGSWLSLDQLEHAFKNKSHAQHFAKFAQESGLVKRDAKHKCKVYYYTKPRHKLGNRDDRVLEKKLNTKGGETSDSDEENETSSSSHSSSNYKKRKHGHKQHQKRKTRSKSSKNTEGKTTPKCCIGG